MYIYIYIYTYVLLDRLIYTYIDRERENIITDRNQPGRRRLATGALLFGDIYIYIYIYICIEREI